LQQLLDQLLLDRHRLPPLGTVMALTHRNPAMPESAVTQYGLHRGKSTDRGKGTPALSKLRICQARARPCQANPETAMHGRVRSKQIQNLRGNGVAALSKSRFS